MNGYKNRVADRLLAEKLEAFGAVLIEGPKYCGKTTLATQQARSILSMADTDTLGQNLALARTNISRLLAGETPRLIDEWQIAPQFWDAVRNEVDKRNEDGQFMLTGSAVPPKPKKDENGNDFIDAIECWLPASSKAIFEQFITKDKDGNDVINLDPTKIPDELKELVGYRIPSEDKYSVLPLRIKGQTKQNISLG